MKAEVGDEVLCRGRHVSDVDRVGVVVEVRGADGAPPYLIRWKDGHESMLFPSADTLIEHHPAPAE